MWFQCFFPRVHPDLALFKREMRKKMKIWDATKADTQGVTTLPDAVTRVPPSLLLQNSMFPVEPNYSRYYNVMMEQMERLKRITEIRESGLAEVYQMADEDVDKLLKACLDANEERCREMPTKKKRTLLRHVLKAVREVEYLQIILTIMKMMIRTVLFVT